MRSTTVVGLCFVVVGVVVAVVLHLALGFGEVISLLGGVVVALVGLLIVGIGLLVRAPDQAGTTGSTAEPTVRMADGREVLVLPQPRTNGMAIASLVLGLLGVSLLGLVFGLVAVGQLRQSPNQSGRGMATAGIVLSLLWLALAGGIVVAVTLG